MTPAQLVLAAEIMLALQVMAGAATVLAVHCIVSTIHECLPGLVKLLNEREDIS